MYTRCRRCFFSPTFSTMSTNGRALPSADLDASLVAGKSRAFLVYRNYDALLEYNCANAYALGVALLGDRIAVPASGPPAGSSAKTTKRTRPAASAKKAKPAKKPRRR